MNEIEKDKQINSKFLISNLCIYSIWQNTSIVYFYLTGGVSHQIYTPCSYCRCYISCLGYFCGAKFMVDDNNNDTRYLTLLLLLIYKAAFQLRLARGSVY